MNSSDENNDILQGKLTFLILITTSDYTSKRKKKIKDVYRGKAGCTFLLEFCISRMKKRKLIKSCFLNLLTCVTG